MPGGRIRPAIALSSVLGGAQATTAQLNTLVTEANADGLPTGMTVSTSPPSSDPFASNYNLFLDVSPGLASDVFLGWDLSASNDSNLAGGYTVSAVAVVPEPMSLSLLALAGVGMLARRRSRKA